MDDEAKATRLIDRTVSKADANFYLIPEMYNVFEDDGPIGKYIGAMPMVGYGSGVYMLTLLDREGKFEPRHCGE
jgi:hypothetical protein